MKPPAQLELLATDLGISSAQLKKLLTEDRFKNPADLVKALQRDWLETRDIPRFMARQQGQAHPQQYVSSAIGAMDDAECVDEVTQRRLTAEARTRERLEAQGLILAMEDVRSTLSARMRERPELQKMAGRSLYRITAELDRVVRNAKRRAA